MGVEFNKQSDAWVAEICRCMTERGLCCGAAIDYLMAQKRAQQPVELEDEPIEVQTEIPPDARVACPKCNKGMTYRQYLEHWTACSKR